MKLGKEAMEALREEVTGRLLPGDELAVVGAVALSGTVLLAGRESKELRKYFSEGFLCNCRSLKKDYGVEHDADLCQEEEITEDCAARGITRIWKRARRAGASALYIMGEGGVLSALWKMAEASGVGLTADLRRIPIRQETVELCERFDLNPYYLMSEGALLIGIPSGEGLVQECRRMGIPAAVIGQANSGNDRLLYSGESVRYLDRPAKDEIHKMKWEELWRD